MNNKFRSGLEKRWANVFEKLKIEVEYEPGKFPVKIGFEKKDYIPDFYVPEQDIYIEVKAPHMYEGRGLTKTRSFAKQKKVIVCNHLGKMYSLHDKIVPVSILYCPNCEKYFFALENEKKCITCNHQAEVYINGEDGISDWFENQQNWLFEKHLYDMERQTISNYGNVSEMHENVYNHLQGVSESVMYTDEKILKIKNLLLDYPNQKEVGEYITTLISTIDFKKNKMISFSPILLVGGPGCGKTSFATELAKILTDRSVVKIELGNDVASFGLTGSNRGYNNAEPGKIIKAMFSENPKPPIRNPVIVFDEFEKIKAGNHSCENVFYTLFEKNSAKSFTDQFFGIPIDASGINYIATANSTNGIAAPILDRFKIFYIKDYSKDEFENILVPNVYKKWIEEDGLIRSKLAKELDSFTKKEIAIKAKYQPRKIKIALETMISEKSTFIEEINDTICFLSKNQLDKWFEFVGEDEEIFSEVIENKDSSGELCENELPFSPVEYLISLYDYNEEPILTTKTTDNTLIQEVESINETDGFQ